MSLKAKEHVGDKFGRLTVVSRGPKDADGNYFWNCTCECGGTKTTRGYSLRRGHVKSCGCIVKESAWDHPKKHRSFEEAAWLFNYRQYLRNSRVRGMESSLEFSEFRRLCSKPCHYCFALPEKRPSQRGRSSIMASGLDRVDNSMGYIDGNVVPCCTWCNRAKGKMTPSEFVKHCAMVANASIARNE